MSAFQCLLSSYYCDSPSVVLKTLATAVDLLTSQTQYFVVCVTSTAAKVDLRGDVIRGTFGRQIIFNKIHCFILTDGKLLD